MTNLGPTSTQPGKRPNGISAGNTSCYLHEPQIANEPNSHDTRVSSTASRRMKQVLLTPIITNSFSRRFHDSIWGNQPPGSFSSTPRAYSTFWRITELSGNSFRTSYPDALPFPQASSGTLYHILMDLSLFEQQGAEALLRDIKILVMSHNIPTRLFSQWNATKVEVPVTLEDVTQSQTTEEVITECLTLILKMGVYLATLKVGNKGLGECLHTAVPELLIPAETIQYLCRSQECLSPAEFLKMYKNPLQPQMDSEIVWPTPTHMST
ncbi:testis-expressed protein 47-like [Ahaetulla prasina]|uniref:testis-expressed protein 47-like n=1 Tax=Ahaetulla prasina TaxID=499056 RepID=UPI00264766FE|nr:testis-expressed protein 47-like [Ahaetulla prasina]